MIAIPESVLQLIEKFRGNAEHYRSSAYNEETCRIDFINPMFEALGWDMANRAGCADAYRDVIHEDAIRVGPPPILAFGLETGHEKEALQRRIDAPAGPGGAEGPLPRVQSGAAGRNPWERAGSAAPIGAGLEFGHIIVMRR